ncbi:MAG TPA: class I SAM-dependent methyltransferase [Actinomycetes bacterium]|jgi:SAM-dependent methyltransferase|nr:class I SAM-dependent methyltransferase [Actinomycetes bacterium]
MTGTREWLVSEAYPDGRNLAARRSIYAYRTPQCDLPALAVEQLRNARGLVVDVGCGDGAYVRALRTARPELTVLGLDLSPGMLAVTGPPVVLADAARLPLVAGSAGALLAMHMLYHLPEPEIAVAELARVRAAGGLVLIATNAAADKAELIELRSAAIRDVTGTAPASPPDGQALFTLEDGERMARRHFERVRRLDFTGWVTLTEPEPLVRFIESTLPYFRGVPVGPVLDRVRARTAAAIEAGGAGAFRFRSHTGFLVGS